MAFTKVKAQSTFDDSPIVAQYQPKPLPEGVKTKTPVIQLKKGQALTGYYLMTFTNKDNGIKTHLLKLDDGRKVTYAGYTNINDQFAVVEKGARIRVTFDGIGRKKPGRRAPFLFTLEVDSDANFDAEGNDQQLESEEASDDFDESAL